MRNCYHRMLRALLLLLTFAGYAIPAGPATPGLAPTDWPGWRGPTRDGRVQGAEWPRSLDEKVLQQAWRVASLGPSYSGPVCVGNLVFTTEARDKSREVVRAHDLASGKEKWSLDWEGAMEVPFFARSNGSWIRSTPAHDGERLFVAGMRDVLVCIEAATGKELWRVDFVKRYSSSLPDFGFVSSPLVHGDSLFVQAGGGVVKLDKTSGKSLWRALADGGGMYGSAFSSPKMESIRGEEVLLVQTRNVLAGLSPDKGKVFWQEKIPAFRGMNILTPTLIGDRLFTSYYGGGTVAFDVKKKAEAFTVERAWEDTAQGYMSTPVEHQGHLYLHMRNQRLTCFDLATGERTWTSSERFGKYISLTIQADLVLGLDERGLLILFRADPKQFKLIESRKVSEDPTWAHVAVSGDWILIREQGALAAWRWRKEVSKESKV